MIGKLVVVLATLGLFTDLNVKAAFIIPPTADQINSNPCTRLQPETSFQNILGESYIAFGPGQGRDCPFLTLQGLVDYPPLNLTAFLASYTYYEPEDVNRTSLEVEPNQPELGIQILEPGVAVIFENVNGTYVYDHITTIVGYVANGGFAFAICPDGSSAIEPFILLFHPPPQDRVVNELKLQIQKRNIRTGDLIPRHHGSDCKNEPH